MHISNLRLGFATNSSSSHSIVFFSDKEYFKNLRQRFPFDSLTLKKFSDITFFDSNFLIKNKNIIRIYVLSQLANAIHDIVKNNELTLSIVRDITGEDLETLIRSEFYFDEDNGVDVKKITKRKDLPLIDSYSFWRILSILYEKDKTNDFLKIFMKKMISEIEKKNVALINNFEDQLISGDEKFFSNLIDFDKTNKLKYILEGINSDVHSTKKGEITSKYDNDYFIFFNKKTGTKVRFTFEENSTYEKSTTPELVDVKITDYCPFGCKFCYMSSTLKGKHADLETIKKTFDLLSDLNVFEVALGGGEPTLHPKITEIIKYGCKKNLTMNLTTYNSKIFKNKELFDLFVKRKISSIGFSVNKVSDVDKILEMIEDVEHYMSLKPHKDFFFVRDFIVAHVVLGAHNYETFCQILNKCLQNDIRILFLGPKKVGLGKSYKFYDLGKQMQYIRMKYDNSEYTGSSEVKIKMFSIDTKFVQLAHLEELKEFFDIKNISAELITPEEGKFSMYIDCVENLMSPSSYCEKDEMHRLELDKEKFLEVWRSF